MASGDKGLEDIQDGMSSTYLAIFAALMVVLRSYNGRGNEVAQAYRKWNRPDRIKL